MNITDNMEIAQMNREEAQEYVNKQAEAFVNSIAESKILKNSDFTTRAAANLVLTFNKSGIVERVSKYLSEGLDDFFENNKQRSTEELNKNVAATIAFHISEIGKIRKNFTDDEAFYKAIEEKYGTIPDGMKPIVSEMLAVDKEREILVSCLSKEIPSASGTQNISENGFLNKTIVNNLFQKLGMEKPDFIKNGDSVIAKPPAIPKNCAAILTAQR